MKYLCIELTQIDISKQSIMTDDNLFTYLSGKRFNHFYTV